MLTKATKPGTLTSGAQKDRGAVVHLIDNPEGRAHALLGRALCGTLPRHEWSDWTPETWPICERCQQRADKLASS